MTVSARTAAALAMAMLSASCGGGPRSASTTHPVSATSTPVSRDGASTAPGDASSPLRVFVPPAERWTYLPETVPTTVIAPPEPAREIGLLRMQRDALGRRPARAADDRFTRVGEATPTRFIELVVDVGRRRSLNPLRMSRLTAMVAVAGHEAIVAAARAQVPAGATPRALDPALGAPIPGLDAWGVEVPPQGLPPEIVAAAAQQTAACLALPVECVRFEQLGRLGRDRLIASGTVWLSAIDAAWTLGVDVGRAVHAFCSTDGAIPWVPSNGNSPPGDWVATPGAYAPALEPFAATWRPWNFASSDRFRPPAPPGLGTPDLTRAARQVLEEGTNLPDRALRVVTFWDLGPGTSTPSGYWIAEIGADALRSAPVADQASGMAVLATALFDAGVASWDAKYHYRSARPVTTITRGLSPDWLPSLPTPAFPGYVSGHSAYSAAAATVLAVLRPQRVEEFYDAAAEACDSRLRGGIHFWFDLTEGATLGTAIGTAALARAGLTPVTGIRPVVQRITFTSSSVRTRTPP